jgi:hypothetical protein
MSTSTPPRTPPPTGDLLAIRVGRALAGRWASLLGLAFGLLSVIDLEEGTELGTVLALAAFGYLLIAVVGRPQLTWPVVPLLTVAVVALRVADLSPIWVFAAGAAVLAVVALCTGRLSSGGRAPHSLRSLQAPASLLFGGLALVATTLVSVQLGSLLVAGGLIAHACWDIVLWRARPAVVARSFVEWCAVYDAVVGVGILAAVVAGA